MSELIVTSRPENFRTRAHFDTIPGDIYNICERIKQKFPTLIVTFKTDGKPQPYVVSEECRDGVIRFVARYDNLDDRIIQDLEYMQRVPYAERVKVNEARVDKHNSEIGKPDPAKQEKWMAEFRQDLIKAGFVHGAETWDSGRRRKGLIKQNG